MKKKKLLSLVLVVAMIMSMSSITVFADYIDTDGHWADTQITKWSERGIISGSGNEFRPDDPITRGEMAAILNNLMHYQAKAENTFSDLDEQWYTDAILGANAAGIIAGHGNSVRPKDKATREEAAVMLGHALGVKAGGIPKFKDNAKISIWAVDIVNSMAEKGYINGLPNGNFNPKANITRAEVIAIINNAIKGFYNKAGTYNHNVDGTVVVNTSGVTLSDMTITGDLILAEGIGNGEATLDNVKVEGKTIIRGGGENSIIIKGGSNIGTAIVCRIDGKISVKVQDNAKVELVIIDDGSDDVIVSGVIGSLQVDAPDITMTAKGAALVEVLVNGKNTAIIVDEKSNADTIKFGKKATDASATINGVVKTVISEAKDLKVDGSGKLWTAEIKGNYNKINITGTKVTVAEGVTGTTAGTKQVAAGTSETVSTEVTSGNTSTQPNPDPGTGNEARTLKIVDKGQPVTTIMIPLNADSRTQQAATKLSEYIKKSTGAELPIYIDDPVAGNNPPSNGEVQLYIGADGLLSENIQDELFRDLDSDGFVIYQYEKRITIAGPTSWGTEYGVDEFLERYVGVSWLAPGEDWEYVPQLSELSVPANDFVKQSPAFFSREFDTHATNVQAREKWAQNNRMHGRVEFKHNLFSLFPPSKYKNTNPEFYPKGANLDLIGGWQPNFSIQATIDEAIKNINAYFDANPNATSYSLGVNDGMANGSGYCEDDPNNPNYPNKKNSLGLTDMSNIYYNWVNEVSKGVFAAHPDKYLGLLAYSEVYDPPTNVILDPRVIVYVTDERLSWGDSVRKAAGQDLTQRWKKAAPGVAFYEYLWGTPYMVPRTYYNIMEDNYKYAKDVGVVAQYAEMVPNFGEGPKPWISTKLQWNPEQDANVLANEWYVNAVGAEAAEDLAAYYAIWTDFWENKIFQTNWYKKWSQSSTRANYMNFLDDSYLDAVTDANIAKSRSLLESVVRKASTTQQKKRAEALLRAFEYYEASALSHSPESDIEQPTERDSAISLVNSVVTKIRYAEKRKDLITAFKDDPFLQQAYSPFYVDNKTLGGYTRVWSGMTNGERKAIVAWLKQEIKDGAVHLLLEDLYNNDPVAAVRSNAYILLRSSDDSAKILVNENPSFEYEGATSDKAESWNLWLYNGLEMSRTDQVKKTGNSSIKVKGIKFGGILQSVSAQPGVHEMYFSYYSPAGSTGKGTIRLQLDMFNAQGAWIGTVRPYLETKTVADTAGEWVDIYWAGDFPEGTVRVEADVLLEGFDQEQEVYIDDFYLNRLSPDVYANNPKTPLNLNGSFEYEGNTPESAESWNYWIYGAGGIQRTSEVKNTGNNSVKLTGIQTVGGLIQGVSVQPGVHSMSVKYYSPAGTVGNGTIRLQIELYGSQNNWIANLTPTGKYVKNTAGSWAEITWTGDLPAGVSKVNLDVLVEGFSETQEIYIDDVNFYRLSPDVFANNPKTPINFNSSFETQGSTPESADSWFYYVYGAGAIQRSSEIKNTGDYSIKISGTQIIGLISQQVSVQRGVHGMSVKYYSPAGTIGNGTIRLQFELYDALNNLIATLKPDGKYIKNTTGNWSSIDWIGEMPAGVSKVTINVITEGFDATQDIYIDDVNFYQLEPLL